MAPRAPVAERRAALILGAVAADGVSHPAPPTGTAGARRRVRTPASRRAAALRQHAGAARRHRSLPDRVAGGGAGCGRADRGQRPRRRRPHRLARDGLLDHDRAARRPRPGDPLACRRPVTACSPWPAVCRSPGGAALASPACDPVTSPAAKRRRDMTGRGSGGPAEAGHGRDDRDAAERRPLRLTRRPLAMGVTGRPLTVRDRRGLGETVLRLGGDG